MNCLHVLPQLRRLERKYAQELVVIGVHSAKFPNERATEMVRHAVARLAVGHPVVNDRDFHVWQAYAVRAWPTLMFIDPRGKVIARHEGEFDPDQMDRAIATLLTAFERDGSLDRRPLSFTTHQEREPDRPLFFPGKVLADAAGGRLFVADSGHHRVVELSLEGQLRRVFGSSEPGLADGDAAAARFNGPQGLALADNTLFVADTENHAIRRIDLGSGRVETLAGTGEQGYGITSGGPARGVLLNSPWDLAIHGCRLYVAMAGCHQIWEMDLEGGTIAPWAGSGRENIVDGSRRAAQFAQPSGLALDPAAGVLYVADSEVSGIRAIDLGPNGKVRTLVGRGLFDFGDQDGVGADVCLQHPLGVTLADGLLYVADSYNHKIKRLDPRTAAVARFLGSGRPGFRDGRGPEAEFSEPGGLWAAAGRLYVADTNNHAVRVCDLASGEVRTLEITGL
ncbi:MAG TPA: thioredoxin-like domain-containing protein [Gemmataceae bacterium]|nr:thioredoxin-like domain-containing protein [Gemmataceae bacterium]